MNCRSCGALMLTVQEYLIEDGHLPTRLVRRPQRDGACLWSISRGSETLNNALEWEYEPQPSSREDDYIKRNRYATAELAMRYWWRYDKRRSRDEAQVPTR